MNTWMTEFQVGLDHLDGFLTASEVFASASLREPGMVSFALLQRIDDPSRFSLFEVFHDDQARETQRHTLHFQAWMEAISEWLIGSFVPLPFLPIYPPAEDWERHLES